MTGKCNCIQSHWPTLTTNSRLLREADDEELAQWLEQGVAGTVSYAACGHAFGPRKRIAQDRKTEQSEVLKRARAADHVPYASEGCGDEDDDGQGQGVRSLESNCPDAANVVALVQQCRWTDWMADLQQNHDKEKAKQEQQSKAANELAVWVAGQSHGRGDMAMGYGSDEHCTDRQEASFLPASDSTFPKLEWIEWVPPARHIAQQALSGNRLRMAKKINLRCKLLQEWKHVHEGVRHSCCAAPSLPQENPELCYVAGACMCDEAGQGSALMVAELCKLLGPRARQGWLKKKTFGRQWYDSSRLVLRLCKDAATLDDNDIWLTLFYGNLNSMVFFSLKLQLSYGCIAEGTALLHLPRGTRPQALWVHLRGVSGPQCVEMWFLSESGSQVVSFAPGLQIHVCRATPTISANLGAPPPGNGPGRLRRFTLLPLPPPDAEGPSDGRAEDTGPDRPGSGVPDADDAPHVEEDNGDEVGGPLGRRMHLLDRELAEIEEQDLWSEDGEANNDSASDDGGFGPAPPSPIRAAPAPPPPPAPGRPESPSPARPSGSPVVRQHGRDRRGHHDGPWNKVESAAWGRFVLNETGTNPSIGCHCPYHGAKCRINKVARRRPVGWMAAWVLAGRMEGIPAGPAGQRQHMELRTQVQPGEMLDQVERAAARIAALADDEMSRVFQWEQDATGHRLPDDAEPEEVEF